MNDSPEDWLFGEEELGNHLRSGEQRREELLREFTDESPAGFRWWAESFKHFRVPPEA